MFTLSTPTKKKLGRIKYCVLMFAIELVRPFVKKDLYLVAGQLHTRNTDPLDSWTFFRWLQEHNIPSRYIVNADDTFYLNKIKGKNYKDIVVLPQNSSTPSLLHNFGIWTRARAFVVEWNVEICFLNEWLQKLSGLRYVMLQHGVSMLWADSQWADGFRCFNDINVSSPLESSFVDSQMPADQKGRCIIGGLPRYENLQNQADKTSKEKIVFVMFTWRNRPGMTFEELQSSEYWKGILNLIKEENVEKLQRNNVKLVISLHHSLIRTTPDIKFHPQVQVVDTKDIRYWVEHAHAVLTDFSSIAFDFLFQKKPVIHWIPDLNDPTLRPDDQGYGSKVLSAKKRRKEFINSVDTLDEVFELIEKYAKNGFVLEEKNQAIAEQYFTYTSDIAQHVYEGIESKIK